MRRLPSPDPQGHDSQPTTTIFRSTGGAPNIDFPRPAGSGISPDRGKNGSRSEDGRYENDPDSGIFGGTEAAERNAYPLVTSLVRLAQRALLPLHGIEKEEGDLVAEEDPRSASA